MFSEGQPVVVNESHPFKGLKGVIISEHPDKWYALGQVDPLNVYLVELDFSDERNGGNVHALRFPMREDDLTLIEEGAQIEGDS
jgi:hypothetical protein